MAVDAVRIFGTDSPDDGLLDSVFKRLFLRLAIVMVVT
jgi:hypothetical protein